MVDRPPNRHARSRAARPTCGFSLLELMVTLSIGAILLGLALPSFRNLMGDSQMSATVNELVHSLQTARSEAIKRALPVTLCTSATPLANEARCDGGGYADGWIVYPDTDRDGLRDPAEPLILQSEPRQGAFAFAPSATFAEGVTFTDSGGSANVAGVPLSGSIRIDWGGADGERRLVSIAANGRVSSATPP